jgi:hypothetical protein
MDGWMDGWMERKREGEEGKRKEKKRVEGRKNALSLTQKLQIYMWYELFRRNANVYK